MLRRSGPVLWFATLVAILPARAAETHLTGETTLRAAPETSTVLGLLTADAPVTEIERQGEWVRIRVEGWVRSTAINAMAAPVPVLPPSAVPAASTPAAIAGSTVIAPPQAAATSSLEGTLQVKLGGGLHKSKLTGAGQTVWLLPRNFDLESAGSMSAEDTARVAELDAQAARIAREAERAMHGSNFTEATTKNNALMAERQKVLEQRAAILGSAHRRREEAVRQAAVAAALVDPRGLFFFPAVTPGAYRLYARLATDRELDLEWLETVQVGATGAKIELNETQAKGLPQGS